MSDEKKLEKGTSGDDKVLRMGTASIPRLITEFAIPSVVGMLINGSYAIIDSVFLGHAVGEIGLSAMTVANPIMIVFMAIAMLIGNGGNALAALRLGEGKRDEAERALGNVVLLLPSSCSLSDGIRRWFPGCSIWRAPRRRCAPTPRRSSRFSVPVSSCSASASA